MNNVMTSSKKHDWQTPDWLFNILNEQFNFDLDVCASESNTKCKNFYSSEDDALQKKWQGNVFMNPPYGRQIGKWVKKANDEAASGECLVVALLPARTDTNWFWDYCKQHEVTFIRGRLKFSGHKNSAPFPSCIVIFERRNSFNHPIAGWIEFKNSKTEE